MPKVFKKPRCDVGFLLFVDNEQTRTGQLFILLDEYRMNESSGATIHAKNASQIEIEFDEPHGRLFHIVNDGIDICLFFI